MRFSLQEFRPTASALEIRDRFYSFRNANIALIGAWLVLVFLRQFTSSLSTSWFISIPVLLMLYIWCCIAYGQLASCFGKSSTNFAVAAFFLYPYELVLGYFAFNRGIRDAFEDDQSVNR
jgi:hypothetical protein